MLALFSKNGGPVYDTPMLAFESEFDENAFHNWIAKYWTTSIVYAAIYVLLIFMGRWYMADRPRFDLRRPLILWSLGLAVFSIAGAVRTIPEMWFMLKNYGFEESVCRYQLQHATCL